MANKIDKREDVSPKEGTRKYGDVEFADSVNHKYPVDTPEHIHAAWRYIHQEDNAAKYEPEDVELIKKNIQRAAKKHDIELHDS